MLQILTNNKITKLRVGGKILLKIGIDITDYEY
jgi:hypothetical protein